MIYNILDTIGRTPLIRLNNINKREEGQILFKYERNNPGGSVKDRSAIYIIKQAEKRGLLKSGGTIIESSSGNFGISLSMIGAAKGYRVIILVDPKTTESNLALLKSFGAEVIVVTEKDDSGSYHKTRISLANKLAEEIPGSFRPDQCFNILNSEAHYKNTAREIVKDCEGQVDVIIAAVSTGGQLGGISKYIKTFMPHVKIIGVDAQGSAIFGGNMHSYRIPGIGLAWTPDNLKLKNIDYAFKVTDEDAFVTARSLAKNEGILMGASSGACTLVALHFAQKLSSDKRIVCMIADGGERYIQTVFNDEWMQRQEFSTETGIEFIRNKAKNLIPWSTCPEKQSNYRTDLSELLNIPETTKLTNKEKDNELFNEKLSKQITFID